MKNSLPYQINRLSGGGHAKGFQVTQNSQADHTVLTFKNRGTGVPQYMLDLPGGGGKIPLLPQYIQAELKDRLIVKNFEGTLYEYPLD